MFNVQKVKHKKKNIDLNCLGTEFLNYLYPFQEIAIRLVLFK